MVSSDSNKKCYSNFDDANQLFSIFQTGFTPCAIKILYPLLAIRVVITSHNNKCIIIH